MMLRSGFCETVGMFPSSDCNEISLPAIKRVVGLVGTYLMGDFAQRSLPPSSSSLH